MKALETSPAESPREQIKKAKGLFQHLAPEADWAEELIQERRLER